MVEKKFSRENLQIACWCHQNMPCPQILLSRIATKPRNSQKFSPSKVPHYTIFGRTPSSKFSFIPLLKTSPFRWLRCRSTTPVRWEVPCDWARGGQCSRINPLSSVSNTIVHGCMCYGERSSFPDHSQIYHAKVWMWSGNKTNGENCVLSS